MKAHLVKEIKTELGEGSIWNHKTQELYWVDIDGQKVFIFNPVTNTQRTITLPQKVGTIVPTTTGNAVVALEDGIYNLDIETEDLTLLVQPEEHRKDLRFNDGKCDPAGRLWVGSIWAKEEPHVAALYKIETDGTATLMVKDVTISNGIVWAADQKTMYYIDTYTSCVKAYDYDNTTGNITNERIAITVPTHLGYPDGMTIDAEGMLWIALWYGSAVVRYNPLTGELLNKIEIPALNITSCAFGGADLDTLYITTASIDMKTAKQAQFPLAGSLFAVKPGVQGVSCAFFGQD